MAGDTTPIRLIGIAGSAGSGKDLATEIICKLYGATNISTSDLVRAITRHIYDLPADFSPIRDQLFDVATFLRNEVNPATTVKLCIFKAQAQGVELAILSGLRSMGEADAVRAAGGIIIAVDADPQLRYDRIYSRQRDTESQKTFDQFLQQDAYENRGVSDTGPGRGISYITESAEVTLENNEALGAFELQIKTKLDPLLIRA